MKPRIVHIAIDYDNPHRGRPTRAIRDFIERLDFADNIVFALKRRANPFAVSRAAPLLPPKDGRSSWLSDMTYWGLPGGIGLALSMNIVRRRIMKELAAAKLAPDIVHAHKMTFEGLTASKLSDHYSAPLLLSIRGEVEEKILRFKPTYRPRYQTMIDNAYHIFFVSAWYKPRLQKWLKLDIKKTSRLPNWVKNENRSITFTEPDRQFVSVLNLNDWRRKGLGTLLEAISILRIRGTTLKLDIIGGGEQTSEDELKKTIARFGCERQVKMIGRVDNSRLLDTLKRYSCLVLPSRNETFGMVYAEAIFAGIPVIMNKNSGIDGYLDGIDVALYAKSNDADDLANKLSTMIARGRAMRRSIVENADIIYERFSSQIAIDAYRDCVLSACRMADQATEQQPGPNAEIS